jgi:hypothetical protein
MFQLCESKSFVDLLEKALLITHHGLSTNVKSIELITLDHSSAIALIIVVQTKALLMQAFWHVFIQILLASQLFLHDLSGYPIEAVKMYSELLDSKLGSQPYYHWVHQPRSLS